jgi:predicted PurR-regulated permease PerM
MTKRNYPLFWLAFILAVLFIFYALGSVIMPFVAGIALAYLLDPAVDRMEGMGFKRPYATFVVLVIFILILIGCSLLLLPVLGSQLNNLAIILPNIIVKLQPIIEGIRGSLNNNIQKESLSEFPLPAGDILKWTSDLLTKLISSSLAFANILSLVIITPIVAFYFLRDLDLIVKKINDWLPLIHKTVIKEQLLKIDVSLAALVRGQACVCIVLAVFYSISLTAVGLQFGILIGIFSGIISFIPFIGAILGGVLAVSLALIQFNLTSPVLFVGTIFLAGQLLEGNFLTPKLIGDAVGLHPIWVIFSLLAGGALFGFLGILLALPTAVVLGVLFSFGLKYYLRSSIYHGNEVDRNLRTLDDKK